MYWYLLGTVFSLGLVTVNMNRPLFSYVEGLMQLYVTTVPAVFSSESRSVK